MKIFFDNKIWFLIPLFLFILGEVFIFWPSLFFISLAVSLLVIVLGIKRLFRRSSSNDWLLFLYFPVIFFLSSALYIIMIPNQILVQLLFVGVIMFFSFYSYQLDNFLKKEEKVADSLLDNLSFAAVVLSVFFIAAATYGLSTFLGWSFIWLLVGFSFLVAPLFFQPIIFGDVSLKPTWPFLLAGLVILIQLTAVFYFLPLSLNILGLLVAMFFYLLMLIFRLAAKGILSIRILRPSLITTLLIIIILLLTSRWL